MIKANDMQVFEILEQVEKAQGRVAKVKTLATYAQHQPLSYMLMWNFAPHVISALPEGAPPFNDANQDGPAKASLWSYLKMLPNFVQCAQSAKIKPLQREAMFIEMLNALDPAEARLACAVKDKILTLTYPSVTLEIVHEAFPHLGLSHTAPKPPTEEELREAAKAELARAEAQLSELQSYIKEIKANLKK